MPLSKGTTPLAFGTFSLGAEKPSSPDIQVWTEEVALSLLTVKIQAHFQVHTGGSWSQQYSCNNNNNKKKNNNNNDNDSNSNDNK